MKDFQTEKNKQELKRGAVDLETQTQTQKQAPVVIDTNNGSDQVEKQDDYIIYNNKIMSYVDDFIMSEYPDKTNEELKTDRAFFPLLVDYLYNNYIGDLLCNKGYKKVVYNDIDIIDNLFNIYISLVYKYKWNNKPYIVEFSLFTGINKDTFYQWLNGDYSYIASNQSDNALRDCITSRHTDAVRKWISVCERALLDNNDTIKDIFILKAKHGYRDNNNDIQITVNHKAIIDADTLPELIGINGKN